VGNYKTRDEKRIIMIKRILELIIILLGVSILSFVLSNISTVDPAEAYARRSIVNPSEEKIAEIRNEMGYNKPLFLQYFKWLGNCIKGDLGVSLITQNPVMKDISKKLIATLTIVGIAFIWIIVITIPLSIISATRKNGLVDYIVRGISIFGISLPSFWLGFILLVLFAINMPIFKVVDFGNFRSIILPSITLAIPIISSSVRVLRGTIISNLNKDYVLYARARGITMKQIVWKHVLKNSIPPIITLFFQNIGFMIGGSAIVESVFSWPGLGMYLVNAIIGRDLPAINGCVLVIAIIFVICNLIAEIINGILNPNMKNSKEVENYG
jgi:ABC-type dipeptide/oligopeptide/nickel transport system permease component